MSNISNSVLIVVFYTIYLLHNIKCNISHGQMEEQGSSSRLDGCSDAESAMAEKKRKYCGPRLTEMVKYVCKSNFHSVHEKRSGINAIEPYGGELTISKECCHHGCTLQTLLKFCKDPNESSSVLSTPAPIPPEQVLRTLLNFFSKSRKLPPNGFASHSPSRVNIGRIPETSLTENTGEVVNVPEFATDGDEHYAHATTHHSHPVRIPESNIVRDVDDDYSVFSVGLQQF